MKPRVRWHVLSSVFPMALVANVLWSLGLWGLVFISLRLRVTSSSGFAWDFLRFSTGRLVFLESLHCSPELESCVCGMYVCGGSELWASHTWKSGPTEVRSPGVWLQYHVLLHQVRSDCTLDILSPVPQSTLGVAGELRSTCNSTC